MVILLKIKKTRFVENNVKLFDYLFPRDYRDMGEYINRDKISANIFKELNFLITNNNYKNTNFSLLLSSRYYKEN